MDRKKAITFGRVIRLLVLVSVGFFLGFYYDSFPNKEVFASFIIGGTMLGFLASDIFELFLFKKYAPGFHRFHSEQLNKYICRAWRSIRRIPLAVYFLIGILWKIFAGILSAWISSNGLNHVADGAPISVIILVTLMIVPIAETLVFQVFPIEISNRITKKSIGKPSVLFSIVVSALLFSIDHRYSIAYMCFAFTMGLYLAFFYSYVTRAYGKDWKKGFAATALLHLIVNLLALLASIIFQ